MKKKYESPNAILIKFDMSDVIVTSENCTKHDYTYDEVIDGVPCDDFSGIRTDDHV